MSASRRLELPADANELKLTFGDEAVRLTNLDKPYWPDGSITKRRLLEYYGTIAPVLVPHLVDRPMVLKRYPDGIDRPFFFMKRAPSPRPAWIETCVVEHAGGDAIEYVLVQDVATLLWTVNLGCIDLNPWYARRDDLERPDCIHFDLDPAGGLDVTPFARVRDAALALREALDALGAPSFPKTTGSRGIHVAVPIERGPTHEDVHALAKAIAIAMQRVRGDLFTATYRTDDRPAGTVLLDYNQNARGRTLASVYSVRPVPAASVSAPVTWEEIDAGCAIEDFTIDTMERRVQAVGDLHAPVLESGRRASVPSLLARIGG